MAYICSLINVSCSCSDWFLPIMFLYLQILQYYNSSDACLERLILLAATSLKMVNVDLWSFKDVVDGYSVLWYYVMLNFQPSLGVKPSFFCGFMLDRHGSRMWERALWYRIIRTSKLLHVSFYDEWDTTVKYCQHNWVLLILFQLSWSWRMRGHFSWWNKCKSVGLDNALKILRNDDLKSMEQFRWATPMSIIRVFSSKDVWLS